MSSLPTSLTISPLNSFCSSVLALSNAPYNISIAFSRFLAWSWHLPSPSNATSSYCLFCVIAGLPCMTQLVRPPFGRSMKQWRNRPGLRSWRLWSCIRSRLPLSGCVRSLAALRLWPETPRSRSRTAVWFTIPAAICISGEILGEVEFLAEVVAAFHEVGQTLMGDVEQINKRLDVACL